MDLADVLEPEYSVRKCLEGVMIRIKPVTHPGISLTSMSFIPATDRKLLDTCTEVRNPWIKLSGPTRGTFGEIEVKYVDRNGRERTSTYEVANKRLSDVPLWSSFHAAR